MTLTVLNQLHRAYQASEIRQSSISHRPGIPGQAPMSSLRDTVAGATHSLEENAVPYKADCNAKLSVCKLWKGL